MTDNFMNKTFGWNVRLPEKTINQAKETAVNTVTGLWDPLFEFIDSNQNVFTGDIAREIDNYTREMFNLGAILRKDQIIGEVLNLRS